MFFVDKADRDGAAHSFACFATRIAPSSQAPARCCGGSTDDLADIPARHGMSRGRLRRRAPPPSYTADRSERGGYESIGGAVNALGADQNHPACGRRTSARGRPRVRQTPRLGPCPVLILAHESSIKSNRVIDRARAQRTRGQKAVLGRTDSPGDRGRLRGADGAEPAGQIANDDDRFLRWFGRSGTRRLPAAARPHRVLCQFYGR